MDSKNVISYAVSLKKFSEQHVHHRTEHFLKPYNSKNDAKGALN